MNALPYEEANEYDSHSHYMVPNESTMFWRDVVKHTPIYRAGAICSSGEVGLLGILPLVRRELVMIDHSCSSLHVAMVKYLVLREKGGKEAYRLFTQVAGEELRAAVSEIKALLPPKVATSFEAHGYADPFRKTGYGDVSPSLKKEWGRIPESVVRKAATKLTRVRFIHGDLGDLENHGPFDLLYLSNALEHISRSRHKPVFSQLAKALKPKGYVLAAIPTGDNHGQRRTLETAGFELVKEKRASYTDASITWYHSLYRDKS